MSVRNITTGKVYPHPMAAADAITGPNNVLQVGPNPTAYLFFDTDKKHETLKVRYPGTKVIAAPGSRPAFSKASAVGFSTIVDVQNTSDFEMVGIQLYGHGELHSMICENVTGLKLTDVKVYGDNGPRITKCRKALLTRCKNDPMTGYGWYFGGGEVPIDPATKAPSRRMEDQPWSEDITIIDGDFGPTNAHNSPDGGQYSLRFERVKNVHIIGGKAYSPLTGKGMCVGLRTVFGFKAEDFEIDGALYIGPKNSGDIGVDDVTFQRLTMNSGYISLFGDASNVRILNDPADGKPLGKLRCSGTTGACISVPDTAKNITLSGLDCDHVYPGAVWLKGDGPNVTKSNTRFRGKKVVA